MAEATDGKVNKQLLKTRSGEFDLESIHSLCLRDAGIDDLGCIAQCTCLERLDLSRNDISKLHKLSGLSMLSRLNLSANRITSLEGLQSLENLQSLNLAGNLIGSLDCLHCLTGLEKLRELRLKDSINDFSNPVCQNINYHNKIISMFPKLVMIDGERLKGKGSELYQMCREIDFDLEKTPESNLSVIPTATKWFDDEFWQPSKMFEWSNLHDAEQQLQDLLGSCKRLCDQSNELLQQASIPTTSS